ncbi:hypothetical protein BGX38DRAFT_1144462 [Terfezia claveryi]|nr:hypothetical protein BGX38DRAFT_1144462 [Terfezia claveryi]
MYGSLLLVLTGIGGGVNHRDLNLLIGRNIYPELPVVIFSQIPYNKPILDVESVPTIHTRHLSDTGKSIVAGMDFYLVYPLPPLAILLLPKDNSTGGLGRARAMCKDMYIRGKAPLWHRFWTWSGNLKLDNYAAHKHNGLYRILLATYLGNPTLVPSLRNLAGIPQLVSCIHDAVSHAFRFRESQARDARKKIVSVLRTWCGWFLQDGDKPGIPCRKIIP